MPTIGDLDSVGRALPHAIGVGAAAVVGDDFDTGVGIRPRRQGLGLAVRRQVEHAGPLEVDERGPIAVAAPPRPVIDPEHANRWPRFPDRVLPARQSQQRVGAGGDGQPCREPGHRPRRPGRRRDGAVGHPAGWLGARPPAPYRRGARRRFGACMPCSDSETGAPGRAASRGGPARAGRQRRARTGCGPGRKARRSGDRRLLPGLGGDDGRAVRRRQDPLDQQACRDERQ